MSHHLSDETRSCIESCLACSTTCLSDAIGHCLHKGGRHTEPTHFNLMLDCAEICRTAANFMARGSDHHSHICRECAEICRACAASCEALGDMQECVEACRRCADECEKMAA
ncbi:MAG TPA: four-helix bundle copper-binding protein [Allosphingosinicella sp.]|nr:four-helix bundle copper-binding protein [Allosphingosinicella sp.]